MNSGGSAAPELRKNSCLYLSMHLRLSTYTCTRLHSESCPPDLTVLLSFPQTRLLICNILFLVDRTLTHQQGAPATTLLEGLVVLLESIFPDSPMTLCRFSSHSSPLHPCRGCLSPWHPPWKWCLSIQCRASVLRTTLHDFETFAHV